MKKHTLYAAKNLTIGGKAIKAGDTLATIETAHDVDRVLNGLSTGAATFESPDAVADKPSEPADEPGKAAKAAKNTRKDAPEPAAAS